MSKRPAIAADGRGWRIAGLVALAVGQAVAAGVAAFATRDAFVALNGGGPAPTWALTAIALAGCVIAVLRIMERGAAERLGCDYAAVLRERLFLHGARTPPSALGRRGGVALRFVGDLAAVRGWVAQGVARLISSAITLPAGCAVLFMLDIRLGAAAAIPLLIGLAALAALGRPLAQTHRRLRRQRWRIASKATERLSHGAALRLVGRVATERRSLAARTRRLTHLSTLRARLTGVALAIPDAAAGVAAAAILATTFSFALPSATAAGALAALGLTIQPFRRLAQVHDRRQAWNAARIQIERALAAPALPGRRGPRRAPKPSAPALAVKGLRLVRGASISLTVARGEVLALTGAAGHQKRSLMMAAAGLESAEAERILVFGRPAALLPSGSFSFVGAASPILRGTLQKNLTLGLKGSIDPGRLQHVVDCAELRPLMERVGGLEGRIGECGGDLSMGERGRLLFARALLDQTPMLLVDAEELQFSEDMAEQLASRARTRRASVLLSAPPSWRASFADRCFEPPRGRARAGGR